MIKLFEHLLPALWRTRPASNPERNDATLARVGDTDPIYRALMDHTYQLLEQAAAKAIGPLPANSPFTREFLAGYAKGLSDLVQVIESTRERARDLALEEQRRLAASRR